LKYFKNDEIRDFVLAKLKSNKRKIAEYLPLLVSNYQKGDYKLLNDIVNRADNPNLIHSLNYYFVDIYKANPTKECKEPLELIYNKMNCGICRINIIRILSDNEVLSDSIFNELQHDSDDEVRQFYRKKKKNYGNTNKRIK
jgi:hypothetical protein